MNGFKSSFFLGNRRRLCAVLPDSYILVPANSMLQSSADITFPFRQDSNFWYLTGIDEPDFVLAINTKSGESTVFVPKQNDYQKEWDGTVVEKALQKISGINTICERSNLSQNLEDAKAEGLEICYLKPLPEVVEPYGFYSNPARRVIEVEIQKVESAPTDIRLEIARLRQVKQQAEIREIQKAIDITGETLSVLKPKLRDFKTEKDLVRALSAGFFERGADGHGFEPIVASGKNAATIHYKSNSSKIQRDGLLLLDVGARVGYYSADISRTWAARQPSLRQKEVYGAVADIQKYAFSLLKPGIVLRDTHNKTDRYALKMKKKIKVNQDKIPHGVSHFLGIDPHDAGDYDLPLTENTILTVEPGIYLPDEGIGVRIEDVVRITKTGIEIMSKDIQRDL